MTTQPSSRISKGLGKLETAQRTYRFTSKLWREFEVDCKLNLSNPRLVVGVPVRYWIDVGPEVSEFIAWYQQRSAAGKPIPKHDSQPVAATRTTTSRPNSADTDAFDDREYRNFRDVLDV